MSKLTEKQRNNLEFRRKLVWDSLFYANQRLDLLIISISGGSLYAYSEVIKYFLKEKITINCVFKIVPILFVLSIIINLISQKTSSKIHENDFECIEYQLDDEKKDLKSTIEKNLSKYDTVSDSYNLLTNVLNEISLYFLITGLFIFAFYLFFTF